jgi:hypothetical protein
MTARGRKKTGSGSPLHPLTLVNALLTLSRQETRRFAVKLAAIDPKFATVSP